MPVSRPRRVKRKAVLPEEGCVAKALGSAAWGGQEAVLSGPSQEPAVYPLPRGPGAAPAPQVSGKPHSAPCPRPPLCSQTYNKCSFPSRGVLNSVGSSLQALHPKGDQSWVFIGRTDVEAETPILWPPDAKS